MFNSQKFLAIYSGVLTAAFAGSVLYGFAPGKSDAQFREITAERINIVEPDGTLRAVFTDSAHTPGVYHKDVETPRDDPHSAGIYFENDEGSENGGLIWGGHKAPDGKEYGYGHLSFDQYAGTQVFAAEGSEDEDGRDSRIEMWDWRARPNEQGKPRLTIGKNLDSSVGLHVKDSNGQNRILLDVTPAGHPQLIFLDENGKEISRLPAEK